MPEDGGLIGQALIGLKPMNAWVHTYTKPQTSSTRSRCLGRRIHESVEDTKLSTNKQHTLSRHSVAMQQTAYKDELRIEHSTSKRAKTGALERLRQKSAALVSRMDKEGKLLRQQNKAAPEPAASSEGHSKVQSPEKP